VLDHFTRVDSLALFLTNPISEIHCLDYSDYFVHKTFQPEVYDVRGSWLEFRRQYPHNDILEHTFGQSKTPMKLFEDRSILDGQKHFKPEDFLILYESSLSSRMLDFIQDHLPAITKLAVIVDDREYFEDLPDIFGIYSDQLQVLFLDRTLRDGCRVKIPGQRPFFDLFPQQVPENLFELPRYCYGELIQMTALKELYFFSKNTSQLSVLPIYHHQYENPNMDRRPLPKMELIDNFVRTMLSRLRMFHINFVIRKVTTETGGFSEFSHKICCKNMINDSIEELKCPIYMLSTDKNTEFRKLRNCHFLVEKIAQLNWSLKKKFQAFKNILELSYSLSGDYSHFLNGVSSRFC